MKNLAVQIVRCVDDQHFPGWVECEFDDAEGRRHALVDKIPIFSTNFLLDTKSEYPQPGVIRCEVLKCWQDPQGHELVRVTIDRPDHVESTEALSEFVVLATQLSEPSVPKEQG